MRKREGRVMRKREGQAFCLMTENMYLKSSTFPNIREIICETLTYNKQQLFFLDEKKTSTFITDQNSPLLENTF